MSVDIDELVHENVVTQSDITLMRFDLKADLRELELRIERQIERTLIVRSATQSGQPSAICRRRTVGSVHNGAPFDSWPA